MSANLIVGIRDAFGGGGEKLQKPAPQVAEPRKSLQSSRVALTTKAALAEHDGMVVEIEGVYTMTDIGPYKLAYERPDGTLATTKLVAGIRLGLLAREVRVRTRGGDLTIWWPGDNASVSMAGPAAIVFEGEWRPVSIGR